MLETETGKAHIRPYQKPDSETVMVDLAFGDDLFEQNRSWDDFWDDNLKHVGHPPNLYRVQDAGSIDGASN